MSKDFSPQNWQQISDYLDGKCSNRDRQIVEELINSSEIWKSNYQSLADLRALLRAAPRRRAPHNFILSQSQADQIRKPRRTIFSFRFASALSTGMAVAVFLFSFLMQSPVANRSMLAVAPAQEKASQTESIEATQGSPIIIWGPPGTIPQLPQNYGYGGGGGGGGGEAIPMGKGGGGAEGSGLGGGNMEPFSVEAPPAGDASIEAAPDAAPDLISEPAPELVPSETSESPAAIAPELAPSMTSEAPPAVAAEPAPEIVPELAPSSPEMTPMPTQIPEPAPAPTANNQTLREAAPEITGSGPILGVNPTADSEEFVQPPAPVEQSQALPDRTPFWVVSGILLAIGILTGVVALFKSDKKRA
jgi:hypothetical protein